MKKINDLENLAKKYRRDLFEKLLIIKQGHPGSIFSMMEIVVALYHGGFVNYDSKKNLFLERVLISKVLATPGTPSSKTCPLQRRETKRCSITFS